MTDEIPSQTIDLESHPVASSDTRLSRWLLFSFLFHLVFIVAMFFSPWAPSREIRSAPVYSVDLIGGEKIGRSSAGTELIAKPAGKAPVQRAESATAAVEPRAKVAPVEREKKTAPVKVETRKPTEPDTTAKDAVALKSKATKEAPTKEATKKEPPRKESAAEAKPEAAQETASLDNVRERIMQSAAERAKLRNESAQKSSKGEVASSGSGEGEGAAALGKGGRGGGEIRGIDFLVYRNRMMETIKTNWSWAGRGNLKVLVHFSIKENGEISGLKVVQASGDPSFDESVLRALKKSSPLAAPPESYRKDFADVELSFRPQDLGT